ncbi:MAG: type II toxin-antitoxin system RelE/ParE family toxin [Actinomycetota bacterium]|nr:type II toxin-antitoxin system RelE/ParE family toxin [Actinomycetota bacterium]
MSLGISFHEGAQAEFDEAVAFYAMERVSLGEGFIQAVEHASAHARTHPESAAVIRGRVRRMRVERFPYSVMYSVVGDVIRVLAVAHDRRRPFYWSRRR